MQNYNHIGTRIFNSYVTWLPILIICLVLPIFCAGAVRSTVLNQRPKMWLFNIKQNYLFSQQTKSSNNIKCSIQTDVSLVLNFKNIKAYIWASDWYTVAKQMLRLHRAFVSELATPDVDIVPIWLSKKGNASIQISAGNCGINYD